MAWAMLLIAGILVVVWAFYMKQSEGFTRAVPTAITATSSARICTRSPKRRSEAWLSKWTHDPQGMLLRHRCDRCGQHVHWRDSAVIRSRR